MDFCSEATSATDSEMEDAALTSNDEVQNTLDSLCNARCYLWFRYATKEPTGQGEWGGEIETMHG